MADLKVFQCPNCKEFINNLSDTCKYCSMEIDANMMSGLVEGQERVDAAYNAAQLG